ncbi:hypothetical protein M413DRAFT_52502, partial [Hebeloma cylindrosporum]
IERLSNEWTSPIYVFFRQTPRIGYDEQGRRHHVFECAAGRCRAKNGRDVRRYLDKGDAKSTSGLCRHATKCFGAAAVETADETRDLDAAREVMAKTKLHDGTITAEFQRIAGKGKVSYSHRQHTKMESSLMKTGQPEYHIPSPATVSRDVRGVFIHVRKCIAMMLQEHEGALHFATDAWTSLNHKAYVAVTVHFENEGVPVAMLLDIVEVACSHSGINLAAAF